MESIRNPQWRNLIICIAFGLAGMGMIALAAWGAVDMMAGGGALIMLGLLFSISSVPAGIMFYRRARLLDGMLGGSRRLLYWQYEPGFWEQYSYEEEGRDAARKFMLFAIIAVFAILFGTIFAIADPEGGGLIVLAVCIGLIAIIGLTAWISVRWTARRNRKRLGDAYISTEGVYLNRVLHSWHHAGSRLESARIVNGPVPVIEIVYSYLSRTGLQTCTVNVPIPCGQMNSAQAAAEELMKSRAS